MNCCKRLWTSSIYVKYKNAILSHIDCFLCIWKNKTIYSCVLPRYLIGSILTVCFAVVIRYLGKYLTIYLDLSNAKESIYKRQNSIFIFTKIGINSGFACEWLVGVPLCTVSNLIHCLFWFWTCFFSRHYDHTIQIQYTQYRCDIDFRGILVLKVTNFLWIVFVSLHKTHDVGIH